MQAIKHANLIKSLQRTIALLFVAILLGASFAPFTSAQTVESTDKKAETTTQSPGSAIQSYEADSILQRGLLVRLAANNSKKVIPVNEKDMIDTFGVVVSPNEVALAVGNGVTANQTYISTSGTYNVIVSDQTGQINKNDFVTISALNGIGMKANKDQSTIVGKALTNFDGKTNVTGQVTLKDNNGAAYKTVNLGLIPVAIAVAHNPLIENTKADLPEWLIRTGLVEKDVQPIRIYLSIGILALAIVVAITVLYAGIRHSVVSIGRNPLSKGSIAKSLLSIFLSAFIILVIGSFTVYLLLKL